MLCISRLERFEGEIEGVCYLLFLLLLQNTSTTQQMWYWCFVIFISHLGNLIFILRLLCCYYLCISIFCYICHINSLGYDWFYKMLLLYH